MSISPIEFPSIGGAGALGQLGQIGPVGPLGQTAGPQAVGGADGEFGSLVLDGLDRLEGLTDKADNLAVEAATGNLENIHDYTIAASEASVASQLTVALRNKAVEAFNEIMRMQV
jgi:flagellar hook-basal body complex protein FliE